MADLRHLGFRGPIMGSLKNSCTTSYRSSIDTIALNCLVFEKIAFLHFGDRQTERQTDGQPQRKAALAVASGGFYSNKSSLEWTIEVAMVLAVLKSR